MEKEIKICSNFKHIRTGLNPETLNEPGYYYPYCEIYGERLTTSMPLLCEGKKFEKKE